VGTFLGRPVAATAAMAVAASTVLVASTMGAAHAADVTFKGTLKGSTGAAAASVQVAACTTDCVNGVGAPKALAYTSSAGAFTASSAVASGSYAIAVVDTDYISGYGQASSWGYLHKEPNGQWSITQSYANATKQTVNGSALTLTLANAIHNPQNKFTQSTTGTVGYLPCAGHTTTFKPTPFSDLPANGSVSYQWYAGATRSSMKAIAGARGTSYTPSATLVGQGLYVSMVATAPNRTNYDQLGSIGVVGNPATCTPRLATMPKSWIKSYGKKHGKAKAGKRVSIVGAKAKAGKHVKVGYTWLLNGRAVGAGKRFAIPRTVKGQKLVVKVTFSRAGYKPRAKVIVFGRVK
jgi:hypothetical protein